ncbi:toll-like receptor 13 isoform X1 [Saccostrea cucullata]|uniref:toll-like receptor 13 isoform X1 n=1 Tax=Saccostrea cuccullata TaxID=36930 RepID=UPI002ED632CE
MRLNRGNREVTTFRETIFLDMVQNKSIRILYAVIFSTTLVVKSTSNNVCPTSPCFCVNATVADCSSRKLETLQPLHGTIPASVTNLDLSGNNFSYINDTFFDPIASLKIANLSIKECKLHGISKRALQHFKEIYKLDLSMNELEYKSILQILRWLNGSQINKLDISDVKGAPTSLPENVFESMYRNSSLHTLHLRNWELVNVSGTTFKKMSTLKKLDLSNNNILELKMEGFDHIKQLNLTLNELAYVPKMCDANNKSYVPRLKFLWLAINHISDSLEFHRQGHCFTELEYLNLSFNAISIFKNNSFSSIRSLKKLRLNDMLTYDLIIEKDALKSKSLEALFFGSNKRVTKEMLKYETIFQKCTNVRTLDMSLFDFSAFTDEDFLKMLSPLTHIKQLILRHSVLNFVPFISHLKTLQILNLHGNFIRHVHKDSFINNTNLHKIILRKNQLTSIHEDSFTEDIWNNSNFTIDVSFNPFACDCDLEWFVKWADAHREKVINYHSNQCDSPKEWKGRHINSNLHYLKMKCHPLNRIFIIILTIGSFVFIFLFTFVLFRKLRWDILFYVHNCLDGRRRGYHRLTDHDLKEYDGFVAYNTRDRKWIMSELVDVLEKKESYKLCLHERNFLPVGFHVDNIFENMEASRKLLLVLTNNFMQDQWCQFETIIANQKLADGNKNNILLILLDNIDSKHFTAALKTLLKEAESVEWTSNLNGRKLFWKKIKNFMCK